MASPFDPLRWYWDVTDTNHGTQVYSARDEGWVPVSNTTYTAWLAADGGNTPKVTASLATLGVELNMYAQSYWAGGYRSYNASADVTLTNPLKSVNDLANGGAATYKIYLPSAMSPRAPPIGQPIAFNNAAINTAAIYQIYSVDGAALLATLPYKSSAKLVLTDNKYTNATWYVFYEGNVIAVGSQFPNYFARWTNSYLLEAITPATALTALGAAPLNSPTFTGIPNTTIPSSGDTSARIPTCGWVDQYYVDKAGGDTISGNLQVTGSFVQGAATYVESGTVYNVQFQRSGGTGANLLVEHWDSGAGNSPAISLAKSRGASIGTRGVVQVDDLLGTVSFLGDTGSTISSGALVQSKVDAVASGAVSARMEFQTRPSGGAMTTRMTIWSDGNVQFQGQSTFKATLSADQTGIAPSSFVKVTFNTAGTNVGSNFNTTNNRWTPPAGRILIGATLYAGAGAASVNINACIYKNGALLNYAVMNTGSATISNVSVQTIDVANGTDYYECYFLHNGASNASVYSGSQTWFWGMRL